MTLSGGMIFRSMRFIWAVVLMVALAGVADGWAASKPAPKSKITVQPVKQTVDLGGSASLMVTATSPSLISYQWRLNKVAIPGANSASYVIDPVTADSAGNYDVVLTNAGGTVTSKQALLTVDMALPSLPVGTALYDEITVKAMGQSSAETDGWMVSSATAMTDPEDDTGSYTFTYKYVSVNRATLTITGSYYDSSVSGLVGATATYTLVFTGVSPSGELECASSGKGALTAPTGYRPAKVPFTFSGTTLIDLPGAPMVSSGSITLTGNATNLSGASGGAVLISGNTSVVTVPPVDLTSASASSSSAGTLTLAGSGTFLGTTTIANNLLLGGSGIISNGGNNSVAGTALPDLVSPPASLNVDGTLTFATVAAADAFSGTIVLSGGGEATSSGTFVMNGGDFTTYTISTLGTVQLIEPQIGQQN